MTPPVISVREPGCRGGIKLMRFWLTLNFIQSRKLGHPRSRIPTETSMRQTAEADPSNTQTQLSGTFSSRKAITASLRRFLTGFAVIIVLLTVDGLIGFFGARSVRSSLAAFTLQQTRTIALVDKLQHAQSLVVSLVDRLSTPSSATGPAVLKHRLVETELAFQQLFAAVPANDPDIGIWQRLQVASSGLLSEITRGLNLPPGKTPDMEAILNRRNTLSVASGDLLRSFHNRTNAVRQEIDDATRRQSIEDGVLLAACLLVSSLFLLTGTRMYYRMSRQAEELNLVSWQLLERQESLAQRLSRELHDELGQSLTALKTNFSRHAASPCVDPAWMRDCTELLKGSIRSAHEISQLLRPTLLDDFGLDCALSWLCERFEERNGIKVRYQSDFHWRLDEQAETHVFRIAQEALTNIARHAEATAVDVVFSKQHGVVRLKISDNGVGLKSRTNGSRPSFGLTGMKARARSLEGEMHIESSPGQGVVIEVVFPAKQAT